MKLADATVSEARASKQNKPLLICFSHLRWDFVFQRPQHLMTRAARDYDLYFFEEPVFSDERKPRLQIRSADGLRIATPLLPHGLSCDEQVEAQRRMLESIVASGGRNGLLFWYYTPMALLFSAHIPPDLIIYDCMDELSKFHGAPPGLTRLEEDLLGRADVTFTGGRSLYEAKRAMGVNVVAHPSSVDAAHFAIARRADLTDPLDQRSLPRPRIGFFGVIDERMDLDLVRDTAALRPDWSFVMLGPCVKIDCANLPNAPNLHWLGRKSYMDLPRYLSHWSAGFMPFARNEATRFISPTKTPEFLAAGLPLVSTSIADVAHPYGELDLVSIADDAESLVAALEREMSRPRGPWLKRVDQRLAQTSWDRTWSAMRAKIAALLEDGSMQAAG